MIKFRFTIPLDDVLKQWLGGEGKPVEIDVDKLQSCDGKLKHKDLSSAISAAVSYSKKKGRTYQGYKCRYCEFWHIGRAPEQ